jgi:hypothetical protein
MKLQPNFSWQKYEGKPEDQKNQFQYQLQQQHGLVSNSVNATIDDESFFTRERQTSFTWIDGSPIWKKTVTGTLAVGISTNATPHGIVGINIVTDLQGTAQTGIPLAGNVVSLTSADNVAANTLSLLADTTNIYINKYNNFYDGLLFQVTIYYTKVRT